MTFPDTPDLAAAAQALAPEAAERLRLLHRLGTLAEATIEQFRAARDEAVAWLVAASADLAARTGERDAARAERDALAARVAELTAPRPFVPANEFRLRLIPLRLALLTAAPEVKARWGVILPELDRFTTVEPSEPRTSALIDLAAADGLLTPDQAAALRRV